VCLSTLAKGPLSLRHCHPATAKPALIASTVRKTSLPLLCNTSSIIRLGKFAIHSIQITQDFHVFVNSVRFGTFSQSYEL
jgi:hypothetical protein